MVYALAASEIVLLALAVVLISLVGRGSEQRSRTTVLAAAYFVTAIVVTGVFGMALINYRIPIGWILAILACAAVLVALIFAIGRDVDWVAGRMVALLGLFLVASFVFGAVMTAGVGNAMLQDLYVIRVKQIAEEAGFTPLMPTGEELPTDTLPVDELPGPDQGLVIEYNGFQVQERKAAARMTEDDLLALVAPGESFREDTVIPEETRMTTLTVDGAPAVALQFVGRPPGATVKQPAAATEMVTILVTVVHGVEVRLWSGGMEKLVDGEWKLYGAFTPNELAEIAESMELVR